MTLLLHVTLLSSYQEALAALLQKAFKATSQDRAPVESSKKWGTLFVVNSLFRLYFKVCVKNALLNTWLLLLLLCAGISNGYRNYCTASIISSPLHCTFPPSVSFRAAVNVVQGLALPPPPNASPAFTSPPLAHNALVDELLAKCQTASRRRRPVDRD